MTVKDGRSLLLYEIKAENTRIHTHTHAYIGWLCTLDRAETKQRVTSPVKPPGLDTHTHIVTKCYSDPWKRHLTQTNTHTHTHILDWTGSFFCGFGLLLVNCINSICATGQSEAKKTNNEMNKINPSSCVDWLQAVLWVHPRVRNASRQNHFPSVADFCSLFQTNVIDQLNCVSTLHCWLVFNHICWFG